MVITIYSLAHVLACFDFWRIDTIMIGSNLEKILFGDALNGVFFFEKSMPHLRITNTFTRILLALRFVFQFKC